MVKSARCQPPNLSRVGDVGRSRSGWKTGGEGKGNTSKRGGAFQKSSRPKIRRWTGHPVGRKGRKEGGQIGVLRCAKQNEPKTERVRRKGGVRRCKDDCLGEGLADRNLATGSSKKQVGNFLGRKRGKEEGRGYVRNSLKRNGGTLRPEGLEQKKGGVWDYRTSLKFCLMLGERGGGGLRGLFLAKYEKKEKDESKGKSMLFF